MERLYRRLAFEAVVPCFLCACFTQLARCVLGLRLHVLSAFASFRAFVKLVILGDGVTLPTGLVVAGITVP